MTEFHINNADRSLFQDAAIAFDLDGTLVDTAPDLVRSLNAVIAPLGFHPVPLSDVRAMVGRGSRALIERAFAREGRTPDPDALPGLVADFIDVYKSDVAAHSRPFDGAEALLDWLNDAGARLSVCTNKPSILADALIAELGLAGRFERIVGPERTSAKKPEPAHIRDSIGTGWRRAAMIGDSAPDVDAAKAAGLPVIVMAHGYSENPADALGADRVLQTFRDLPSALVDLWRGAEG